MMTALLQPPFPRSISDRTKLSSTKTPPWESSRPAASSSARPTRCGGVPSGTSSMATARTTGSTTASSVVWATQARSGMSAEPCLSQAPTRDDERLQKRLRYYREVAHVQIDALEYGE